MREIQRFAYVGFTLGLSHIHMHVYRYNVGAFASCIVSVSAVLVFSGLHDVN